MNFSINNIPKRNNPLVGLNEKDSYLLLIVSAFFKYEAIVNKLSYEELLSSLDKYIDNDVCILSCKKLLENKNKKTLKTKIEYLLSELPNNPNELKNLILSQDIEYEWLGDTYSNFTPQSIIKLALYILNVGKTDKFADFCTGTGSVLHQDFKANNIFACDTDMWCVQISSIRAVFSHNKIHISNNNISDLYETDVVDYGSWDAYGIDKKTAVENGLDPNVEVPIYGDTSLYYDKIFCHYPISRPKDVKSFAWKSFNDVLVAGDYNGGQTKTLDWFYNYYVRLFLEDNGDAVCITTAGELFNTNTIGARINVIKQHEISMVVALPNIFRSMPLNLRLIVFSKKKNKHIRMVDASTFIKNVITPLTMRDELDFDKILECLSKDVEHYSRLVPYEELKDSNFSLEPEHYVSEQLKVENGVSLEDLTTFITRGSNLGKSDLKKLSIDKKTEFKYLTLSDIEDGTIKGKLKYLSKIDNDLERYCVEPNDIVISKTGPKFKVWWRNKYNETSKILASSNLYILKFNNPILEPEYIAIYLRSSEGQIQLKRCCTGSVIKNIPISALKRVRIPFVEKDLQESYIKKYHEILSEIRHHEGAIKYQKSMLKDLLY